MKKNAWFIETFLPSLKNGQWLSEKQMQICKRYMIESRYYSGQYLIAIDDKVYTAIQVSARKGYGSLHIETFPYNVEERVTNQYGEQFRN